MKVKVEKRINDIEESLKLLAKYMKEESTRIEKDIQKSGDGDLSHIEQEISDIKKRIEEAGPDQPTTDIEKKMQAEIKRLENLIYLIPKEKVMKDYSEKVKDVDELKKSVDLKLQVIESKLKNTADDMISSKFEDVQMMQEQLKRLEERLNDTVFILENLKGASYAEEAKKLEKRLKLRLEEIDEQLKKDGRHDDKEYKKIIAEIGELREREKLFAKKEDMKDVKKVGEELEEIGNRMKHFQRKEDLTRMMNEIKGRFEEFETRVKKNDTRDIATKKELEEVMRGIGEYKKLLQEIEEMKEREKRTVKKEDVNEFKKNLDEVAQRIEEISNKIKHLERKDDFTKSIGEIKGKFEDVDKKIICAEKIMQSYAKKSDMEDLLNITRRFSQAFASKENIDELMKEIEEYRKSSEKKISLHGVEIKKVLDEFERFKTDIEKKTAFEDVEIDKIRKKLEDDMNAASGKLSLSIQEIRNKVEREAKEFYDFSNSTNLKDNMKKLTGELMILSQRISETESAFDKRIAAVENKQGDAFEQDVMDVRSDVDDVDKRLVEIEMSIKDLKSLEAKTRKALEHLENFDRDTKAESMKFVTAQLNEFAKHVDRRLPAVVTREDFTRSMIEMNHKISTLETPDFTYVNRRMQALEGKVNEIYSMLKAFSRSVPVVVE